MTGMPMTEEVKAVIKVVEEYGAKYGSHIPVVTAGGIYTHEDVMHQLELGADGVQVGTRFVTTEECDASDAYKQAYIKARKGRYCHYQEPGGNAGKGNLESFLKTDKGRRPGRPSSPASSAWSTVTSGPFLTALPWHWYMRRRATRTMAFCSAEAMLTVRKKLILWITL